MSLPSPDGAAIAAIDGLLAIPQRKGVPLPLAVAPLFFLLPVACFLIAVSIPGLGSMQLPFVPAWIIVAVVAFGFARKNLSSMKAEAGNWTPSKAQDWRARAMSARETQASIRSMLLFMLSAEAMLVAIGSALAQAALLPLLLNVGAYMSLTAATALILYARCAMPHDPDLRAPVPMPA